MVCHKNIFTYCILFIYVFMYTNTFMTHLCIKNIFTYIIEFYFFNQQDLTECSTPKTRKPRAW
jgi:hypothetical protein